MDVVRKDIHNSEVPVVCRACEARHGGVCGAMTPAQLTELSRYATRKTIESGSELHGQGQAVVTYANILKGVVKLTKVMEDGRQQIVGLQFAPDFLGRPFVQESALTAEAATEIEICAVSKSALERMIRNSPELEHRLHGQALKELDDARDWMLTLGRKTAKEKVASFLHFLAANYDPESIDIIKFDIPLTRQEIADFLGLTIETVSRQMTRLRQDGVINIVNNRAITIPNVDRLAEAAGKD